MDDAGKAERTAKRERIKAAIVAAITSEEWPASDVGEVLLSIGAAMTKAGGTTEADYLNYCRATWKLQTQKASGN